MVHRFFGCLSLTTDNHTIAYDALVKRYSNSRLRAQALWSELDNAPKVNSDNVSNLGKLLDYYSENLAALKQMKFPTDSWDFLLLMMLLKRLDHGIVTRFELEHGSSSIPKYIDLTDFLEKHCLALDTIDVSPSFGQVKRTNYNINSADYTLLTVVYGVSSSPYLALKVLLQLAEDEGKAYPLAAENIRHSSYVDDFVGGASTFEEARVLITELIALMKLGGFELRKWSSNEPSLLSDLPDTTGETERSYQSSVGLKKRKQGLTIEKRRQELEKERRRVQYELEEKKRQPEDDSKMLRMQEELQFAEEENTNESHSEDSLEACSKISK
ncbi:hypothetical protein JTB14_001350 [Gonioctena quinquepunctata]|nr:hypothetical protein JTB14_001350 [Gonioctena quinquepunctata]